MFLADLVSATLLVRILGKEPKEIGIKTELLNMRECERKEAGLMLHTQCLCSGSG